MKEPAVDEFFASSSGVCVYVNLGKQSIRVEFEAPDRAGVARGGSFAEAARALAVATASLQRHREELMPLFRRVAAELASRAGTKTS